MAHDKNTSTFYKLPKPFVPFFNRLPFIYIDCIGQNFKLSFWKYLLLNTRFIIMNFIWTFLQSLQKLRGRSEIHSTVVWCYVQKRMYIVASQNAVQKKIQVLFFNCLIGLSTVMYCHTWSSRDCVMVKWDSLTNKDLWQSLDISVACPDVDSLITVQDCHMTLQTALLTLLLDTAEFWRCEHKTWVTLTARQSNCVLKYWSIIFLAQITKSMEKWTILLC